LSDSVRSLVEFWQQFLAFLIYLYSANGIGIMGWMTHGDLNGFILTSTWIAGDLLP